MPNYDLSSIGAVAASAELARVRASREPNQDSYNAAWLHGYADALANVADALEPQQELMDAIISYMGEQHDSAELYDILHEALAMSDKDILSLGFDLPQCREQIQQEKSDQKKKRRKEETVMKDNCILTAESVTEGHPDKLCDTIADSVLDACLQNDPAARVACEVMATAGKIIVAGEITVAELPDIPAIVCRTVRETGYGSDYEVEVITHDQSGDIAGAVAQEAQMGAGDQGIVYGFACSETAELLPLPVVLAHRLTLLLTNARKTGTIQGLGPDGKAQVSVEYQGGKPYRIAAVVVSCQHDEDKDLDELRREIIRHVIVPALRDLYPDHKTEVFINPSGRFVLGGFEADTGLTGRKLMADTYGGLAPHGGGALSGKDGSKVDRSGAYMARYIAKNIVAAGLAEKCTISLAYAIGRAEPVAVDIDAHQTGKYPEAVLEQAVRAVFGLTPAGMISALGLDRPIFVRFCNYGHFTHQDAPWEQTDRAAALADACGGDRSHG